MKLKVTKASAFEIDPSKKYVCIVAADINIWSEGQRAQLTATLAQNNIELIFIPEGSKFKLMEQHNGQTHKTAAAKV